MNIKVALVSCVTFLIGLGVVVTYMSQKDRYTLYPQANAMYIFDSKTATLNYCTDKNCQMVTPQSLGADAYATLAAAGMAMPNQPFMMPNQFVSGQIMGTPNQASIVMGAPSGNVYPQVMPPAPMNMAIQGSLAQPAPNVSTLMQPQQQPVQIIMMSPTSSAQQASQPTQQAPQQAIQPRARMTPVVASNSVTSQAQAGSDAEDEQGATATATAAPAAAPDDDASGGQPAADDA